MNNEIERPAHYDFGQMEAREIIELAIADFRDPATVYHVASALKYLLRASRKNGADDIAKARKHVVWAEDAARAHEKRLRAAWAPLAIDLDAADLRIGVNFDLTKGGIRDAGEFTQSPNCGHPMAAEVLRMADEQPCNQPRRSESAWSVTWPGDAPSESAASITEYQTLVGN